MILSIDPGLRHCGVAVFEEVGGTLLAARLIRNSEAKSRGPEAWKTMAIGIAVEMGDGFRSLLIELQQIYTAGKLTGRTVGADPNDLLQLSGVVGALSQRYSGIKTVGVLPREWKGQVDADVMTRRIESKLSPREKQNIFPVASSLRHNVIDAIGIGLWYFQKQGLR